MFNKLELLKKIFKRDGEYKLVIDNGLIIITESGDPNTLTLTQTDINGNKLAIWEEPESEVWEMLNENIKYFSDIDLKLDWEQSKHIS